MHFLQNAIVNNLKLRFYRKLLHGKNDFAEGSKILLDTDLKIILLNHQNNFIEILKIMLQKILIF